MHREMKRTIKAFYRLLLGRRTAYPQLLDELPGNRFLVCSPHPDDEVLGCGGTIIKLVESRRTVQIVHLTDGNRGTNDWKSSQVLAETRRNEALNAARL